MADKLEAVAGVLPHILRHDVFYIGPIPITSTVINTWLVMIALVIGVWLLRRKGFKEVPTGVQCILEAVMEFIYSIIDSGFGRPGRKFVPIVGGYFLFILAMNISWFIPDLVPPTTDIMTTAALGISAVLLVHATAIYKKGLGGYLKQFVSPNPILLPMNILEEVTKPFSLALRLFGNMFGEKMVTSIMFVLVPLFAPVPVMALGLLMGAIQAYIFSLLVTTYLAHFHSEEH